MNNQAKQIEAIIDTAEKYKNCYFWNAARTNAAQRRREEFDNNYRFEVDGDVIEVNQYLSISCKNYYYGHTITKNGKKTNITALKTALRKASAAA